MNINRRLVRSSAIILTMAALFGAPLIVGTERADTSKLQHIVVLLVLAMGLNVVAGFAGQLAIGSGATLLVSAYAAVILTNDHPKNMNFFTICLVASVVGAIFGLLIALPALRLSGFYLALVTLFAGLLVPLVARNIELTGSQSGITLVSNFDWERAVEGVKLYEIMVGMLMLVLLFTWLIKNSQMGRRFSLLRESEELTLSLGISTYSAKLLSFVISSLIGGLAGGMYVYSQQFVSPGSATTNTSILLLAACVIGGIGTVMGPLLGGVLVIGLGQFLGVFDEYQGIIFGLLLAICAIMLPEGMVGAGSRRVMQRWFSADGSAPPSERLESDESIEELLDLPTGSGAAAKDLTSIEPSESTGLHVANVVRTFGGIRAVDDVSLDLRQGEIHALLGSNGSGKTTLLNLVTGFYKLDSGSVSVDGRRLDGQATHRLTRSGIVRTFQTPKLMHDATVLENVRPAAELHSTCRDFGSVFRTPAGRRASRDALARAHEALRVIGVDALADVPAGALPHGTLRLIEVARALALNPRFVLLDEPAAGLSIREMDLLAVAIRRLATRGIGVLLVEHNIPFVVDLADQVTVMHQGRVIAQGTPSLLFDNVDVAEAFLGTDFRAMTEAK